MEDLNITQNASQKSQANSAQAAFFYLLGLVSLGFLAMAVGNVAFQIIEMTIIDVVDAYSRLAAFSSLRFAISAMVVAGPIFYFSSRWINKRVFEGVISEDSGVRRWLTYFILFVTAVTLIGDVIGLINTFLNGELTLKFFLKILVIALISGFIFAYYLYDIRREHVRGRKDPVIKQFFWASLIIIIAAFVAGIFYMESPAEARKRRIDNEIINNLSAIESGIQNFYQRESRLPETLDEMQTRVQFVAVEQLRNPATQEVFIYTPKEDLKYELCADFQRSDRDDYGLNDYYYNNAWRHDAGYYCFDREVIPDSDAGVKPIPVERPIID